MKKLFVLALTVFFLLGCKSSFNTAPILDFKNQTVQGTVSMEQVEKSIMLAGYKFGWKMYKVEDGLIEGTLNVRTHTAIVTIPYSTKSYSIIYKSSVNLYEDGKGIIHKSYNRWVNNLDKEISANIGMQALAN